MASAHYSDFRWVDNLNIDASDWSPLTFTAPSDPRLPNGGGEEITIYEWNPGFAYSTGNLYTTLAPDDWRSWNGFEVIVDGTLPRGGFMNASWTAGASENHRCTGARDNPNALRFCHNSTPYRHMGKLSGAVPLPFETMISGLFQMFAGDAQGAFYRAGAFDAGGRTLNVQDETVDVQLIEPGTMLFDATTRLQLRFMKDMDIADWNVRVYMTADNIFNKAAVTRRNQVFGGGGEQNVDYHRPVTIQPGRRLTFGIQTSF